MNSGGLGNMRGGMQMIYNTIEFRADPFSYFLSFTDRITLVRGDSATGKTYLYQMLEDLKMTKEYQKLKLFNYKSEEFHSDLKKCRDKFVVIDSADLLLDDADRNFINFNSGNQYMLFARNCDGLNLSAHSFVILNETDYKVSLQKELVGV